jgi:hypothetical protein
VWVVVVETGMATGEVRSLTKKEEETEMERELTWLLVNDRPDIGGAAF